MADIAAARALATELIEQIGVKTPPVPVERIAKQLGVIVQYAPFDDELSGMAFLKDNVAIIGINSSHHPNRQRYTLAHELPHEEFLRQAFYQCLHPIFLTNTNGNARADVLNLMRLLAAQYSRRGDRLANVRFRG